MMDHIVAHSLRVCQVALVLADALGNSGHDLDRNLIQAGALLHDITKTRSFETHENHAETGGRLLEDLGYPAVASIIRQHVRLDVYATASGRCLNEAVFVNYADKRVLNDNVVSLARRMQYITERYCKSAEDMHRISLLWERTRELERQIFSNLAFSPDDLGGRLSADAYRRALQSYHAAAALVDVEHTS